MIGAAAEAAGIDGDPHHPLPDHRARTSGTTTSRRTRSTSCASSPPGGTAKLERLRARGLRTEVLRRPRAKEVSGEQVRAAIRDGGDWRGPGAARGGPLHRRPSAPGMRSLLVLLLDGLGRPGAPRPRGAHGQRGGLHPQPGRPRRARLHRPALPARPRPRAVERGRALGHPGLSDRPSSPAARSSRPAATALHRPPARCSPTRPCRTTERRDGAIWVTGRAGPGDAGDAGDLVGAIPRRTVGGLAMELRPLVPERGEGVLRRHGRRPRRGHRLGPLLPRPLPMLRPRPLVPGAAATARAAELWSRATLRALARHRSTPRGAGATGRPRRRSRSSGGAARARRRPSARATASTAS